MEAAIERIVDTPTGAFDPLVTESEKDGWRLVRRLADEWASGANRFDGDGEALFIARLGGARSGRAASMLIHTAERPMSVGFAGSTSSGRSEAKVLAAV